MLRIYDANFNRCSEGLRVLEETARFLLNDTDLTKDLKHIRHQLAQCYATIKPQLLTSRDSVNDVGIKSDVASEYERGDLAAIVTANARRAQESLRVLEEYAKLPDTVSIDARTIEQMRFSLYQLERRLTLKLLRKDKADRINGVYLIGEMLKTARELKQLCAKNNVLFIVDNYIDIALVSDADGVHLSQTDLPVDEARKLMPIDKIIGCTATSTNEALLAGSQGADYISVGSVYPTQSKEDAKLVGLETLREIRQKITQPVVAIGGINLDNIKQVLDTNANAVAVISVIMNRDDVKAAASELGSHFKIRQGD